MADTTVHIGENSSERIAYKLMQDIMTSERKSTGGGTGYEKADRKYILDTYAECLHAVQSRRGGWQS